MIIYFIIVSSTGLSAKRRPSVNNSDTWLFCIMLCRRCVDIMGQRIFATFLGDFEFWIIFAIVVI